MITITRVTTDSQLMAISRLQAKNLRQHVSDEEAQEQGFLTAEYPVELLRQMNDAEPAIIALDNGNVAGYALVATKAVRDQHPLLQDLFNTIDSLSFKGISLSEAGYVVVGQLCVAKEYRGLGLVKRLYDHFREVLSHRYKYCVTDVAQLNHRSLAAHARSGFQVIHSLTYGGIGWDVVLWDWNAR